MTTPRIALLLDCSLRVAMDDQWEAAVAGAASLAGLLKRHGQLTVVGYSETARVLEEDRLADLGWDFVYGTNLEAALKLARQLLGPVEKPKRTIVVADAEPSAHCLRGGDVFFTFPPIQETTESTLEEARSCSRDGIRVDFLLLRPDASVRDMAERIAAICDGRVGVHPADQPIAGTAEGFLQSIGLLSAT